MKQKWIKRLLFSYYVGVAVLWIYLIATSMCFSYEHFMGRLPDGIIWIFVFIGFGIASRFFMKKIAKINMRINDFLLVSFKDVAILVGIALVALIFISALSWVWLKLFPMF